MQTCHAKRARTFFRRTFSSCKKGEQGSLPCAKHVAAHKTATLALKTPESAKGKHGMGIRSVVCRINNEMLTSPGNRKLSVSTVHCAVQRGEFGISPKKIGRRSTLQPELTHGLAVHSIMMQLSGEWGGDISKNENTRNRYYAWNAPRRQANPRPHLKSNKA